ncbi:protein translocase subunit SecF [Thermoclostridium stercorarium subsp. stercorarium DSM 8532]|jgi:preprotein translocase subunit SecF|uniref:Protein-export membrane protein SecF n=3 Tax=Thermoclostridium stercorarium TaxID=1510 RepID=L7VLK8_THES1|nr:protein translocase subunit SecF [Thermoclostridium stercorarium]AGC69075.1 protein translocase subunit SecF [Thermoclostridium stercorarium subsp. stercorarium DSM 8532]AGI40048.1 SecF [Thermoclostridium stercorarium subsp. stercorarium DSM 8532]ANW99367.1 preprotein translocase subunit SecF [Thermoclostridium stercorarium subsp. thermolacticum DSM 2910]ANX01997.1 preprotein translocase subunit SecF [Thermoclostridium stercorarium subsp. leptospartum DSM 9219]UZQ85036.1 protein translocase
MKQINVVKHQKKFFLISLAVIAVGIIFYFINGIDLDIEFSGGTRIMIETNSEVDPNLAEDLVEKALGKSVTAQTQKTNNPASENETIYMLRLDIASEQTLTAKERDLVIDVISENFDVKEGGNQEMLSVEPSIGRETLLNGLRAVLIASVIIILYVTWRFSAIHGLAAAITAIIALIHDILITLAMYPILKYPLGEVFISAILTIIGYSLNDTIIIYDRIRENMKLMKKSTLDEIVNTSINQSLTRTINTSATTLITLITLFIFAAVNNISSLVEFSLPLIVGFVAGVYSTVFIASPLWLMWRKRNMAKLMKSA